MKLHLEKVLNQVVDATPAVIYIKDADGKYLFINNQWADIIGVEKSNIIGRTDLEVFDKDIAEQFMSHDQQVMRAGRSIKLREIATTRDGIRHFVSLKSPLVDNENKIVGIYGISTDITDMIKLEAELQHASKLATIGEMAAGIAHEINNPLAIIHALASQLKRSVEKAYTADDIVKTAFKIQNTVNRISKIVKGLLSLSRNQSEGILIDTDLSSVIEDTLNLCQAKFKYHNVDIIVNNKANPHVMASPTQLSQVLLNLLNNSYDAIEPLSDKWIKIDVRRLADGMVKILVVDCGTGIPESVAKQIMQPFFTTKKDGSGTGLGLSISKNIIEGHHQGRFYYELHEGHTAFCVELKEALPLEKSA